MCGHVGVAGNIFMQEKKVFQTLLHLDQLRGPHSTGIAAISGNNIRVVKSVGTPQDLYEKYPEEFEDDKTIKGDVKCLIGHNRWATVGAKTDDNAHPFVHGDIVGAHNGTLTQITDLEKFKEFQVDSESIFYNINNIGLSDTISHMNGAWALVYYDAKKDRINFLRNSQRPLVYARSHDCIFWASEDWMLEVALGRHNIRFGKIEEFDANQYHYVEFKPNNKSVASCKLFYVEELMKGKEAPKYTTFFGGKKEEEKGSDSPFRQPMGQHLPARVDLLNHSTSTGGSTSDWNKYQYLIGKEITMEILGERLTKGGVKYLYGHSNDLPFEVDIRIFSTGHTRYDEWAKSTGYYKAKIRRVVPEVQTYGGIRYYVIPEYREVSEEFHDYENTNLRAGRKPQWDATKTYEAWQGERLTLPQFLTASKNGCQDCGGEMTMDNYEEAVWTGPKAFLCHTCADRQTTENILAFKRK